MTSNPKGQPDKKNGKLDYVSISSNFAVAIIAQGVSFVLSALTSLVVPKMLGVEEFGYWQLFMFYASYVGLFHFGLHDGVYLLNGGKTRDELDRRSLTSQLLVCIFWQVLIAICIISVVGFLQFGMQRFFTIVTTCLYIFIYGITSYFGFVFQAINETKLFSLSTVIDRLSFLIPLLLLLFFGVTSFEPYIIFWLIAKMCSLVYCVYMGRDIIQFPPLPLKIAVKHVQDSIRVGIKLMLANVASQLILGVMQFAIDAKWDIATFGMVSFSLTLTNFFLQFLSQAAMVLFPALRRSDNNEQKQFFVLEKDLLGLLLPLAYIAYFPIVGLLSIWLPQYRDSFGFFALLLPICLFDGKMSMVSSTFFKVLRMEDSLFKINGAAVLINSVLVLIGVSFLGNVRLTLIFTVVIIALRSVVSESILMKHFFCYKPSALIAELCVSAAFVTIIACFGISVVSACLTIFSYTAYIVFRHNTLTDSIRVINSILYK